MIQLPNKLWINPLFVISINSGTAKDSTEGRVGIQMTDRWIFLDFPSLVEAESYLEHLANKIHRGRKC